MLTVSSDKLRLFLHGHHLVRRPAHAGRAGSRAAPPRNPGDACCDPPVQPDRLARLCVLLATGIRNIAAEQDKITGSYRTTVIAKLVAVLAPGVTASLHARSRSTAGLAVFGALTGASALAALFLAILRAG